MIAKVIATAQTREEAIATMERALSEFVVEGVKTTIPFHVKMLKDENFRTGNFNTQYLNNWTMDEE
jgi:acetyl-CoA carboxylase biotin carboxylase subunit